MPQGLTLDTFYELLRAVSSWYLWPLDRRRLSFEFLAVAMDRTDRAKETTRLCVPPKGAPKIQKQPGGISLFGLLNLKASLGGISLRYEPFTSKSTSPLSTPRI